MRKKPGYPYLLAVTVVSTLTGVFFLVRYLASPAPSHPGGDALSVGAIMAPIVLAGVTCVIRKRFFTIVD